MTVFGKFYVLFSAFALWVVAVTPANAHWGHLGDLAGHSHWVGLGAVVVAGALATVLGKLSDSEDNAEDGDEVETGEEPALHE